MQEAQRETKENSAKQVNQQSCFIGSGVSLAENAPIPIRDKQKQQTSDLSTLEKRPQRGLDN
jgi:hypothetical protein